ncbi:protein DEPP-like [Periophthalmus magnuspinnatus]|uniref:protein DEPP-like n=1 Tax=Periophthalmus magnuspinnatus TaxID=409849 RepID=UPI00145AFC36|nr:protein DEPP-like [Periophthalmus magnuspinnatus]
MKQLQRMKHRRLLLSLPHLPTITETLEDASPQSLYQPAHSLPSLDDYMASMRALACSSEAPSCGPVRLQRGQRGRPCSKAQMKLPATGSLPRGSPRALRTSKGLAQSPEELSVKLSRERDCRGKDPVDWLFGQRT